MDSSRIVKYIVQYIVLVGLQILLLKDFVIGNVAYTFPYIGAFLLVPFELGSLPVLFLAFGTGLLVDVFYDTLGIHAAASVLAAFLRQFLLKVLTPAGGYEGYMEPTFSGMGINWYVTFMGILAFVHHFVLFSIEYSDFSHIFTCFINALCSAAFTFITTLLLQNVLVPK